MSEKYIRLGGSVPPYAEATAKAFDALIDAVVRTIPPSGHQMQALEMTYDAKDAAIRAVIAGTMHPASRDAGREWDAFAGRWRESRGQGPAIGRKTTAA